MTSVTNEQPWTPLPQLTPRSDQARRRICAFYEEGKEPACPEPVRAANALLCQQHVRPWMTYTNKKRQARHRLGHPRPKAAGTRRQGPPAVPPRVVVVDGRLFDVTQAADLRRRAAVLVRSTPDRSGRQPDPELDSHLDACHQLLLEMASLLPYPQRPTR